MADGRNGSKAVQALLAISVATPVLVLVAALGTRTGLWSPEIGYDLVALRIGWVLAIVGAVAAVAAAVLAFRNPRRLGGLAALAVVVGLATLGTYVWQSSQRHRAPPEDITTNLAEIPGFGDMPRPGAGQGGSRAGVEQCPGALPLNRQVAPESAAWALQQAGFAVRGAGVARADGTRRGFWFGFRHDAVIRIRPGRTDIRVAARDSRSHGGAACELVTRISEALRSGR